MAAHRFRFEMGGSIVYGLAFDSEEALEAFLGARGVVLVDGREQQPRGEPQRRRGRPSFDELLAGAIDALGVELDRTDSLAAQARLVREHIEATGEQPPSQRKVETFLAVYRRPILDPQKITQKF